MKANRNSRRDHARLLCAALLVLLATLTPAPAMAALNVLACEPEWAALVSELAGARAQVHTATTAMQDPHRIEARPALIARARRADLLVCTGAGLEAGWLPLLQRESANPRIQTGQPGYFAAADYVHLLERPERIDRALGDVHAAGNPHLHLDPRNLLPIAAALSQRLRALDPAGEAQYAQAQIEFEQSLQTAISRWQQQAARLRGLPVLVQHQNWSYLAHWLGLEILADLEPRPGLEPSVAHLSQLLAQQRRQPAQLLLRASYLSPRASDWLSARTPLTVVVLPFTVGGSAQARDLFGWYEDIVQRLLEAAP